MAAPEPEADDLLDAMASPAQSSLSVPRLLEEIIRAFGGIKGYVEELRTVYKDAPQGGQIRARILTSTLMAILRYGEQGEGLPETTEELEETIRALARQMRKETEEEAEDDDGDEGD